MARRAFSDMKALQLASVTIMGSFAPNGTGAVAATSRKGPGWSVARTGVGAFLVTFNADLKFQDLVKAAASVQLAIAADTQVQVGTYDSTARTLVLTVLTAGAAADIAANANNRIHFEAVFRNTPVGPVYG